MKLRYTMDNITHENEINGKSPLNFNSSNLRFGYKISNKPTSCGDSNYNSACSDCSHSSSMGVPSITTITTWKIFSAVMLHAWRKRKDEVKKLLQSIEDLEKGSARTKNQLHVYNTLIRVEQKRNDELTSQLKRTLCTLEQTTSSCESMSKMVQNMEADKALLEHELKVKYEEYDAIHAVLAQTKIELYRSMREQRNLQTKLCNEQRRVLSLESENKKLTKEICEMNTENRKVNEFGENACGGNKINIKLAESHRDVIDFKKKTSTKQAQITNKIANSEDQLLRPQVSSLQDNVSSFLSQSLNMYWGGFLQYRNFAFRYIHLLIYYILPATPPPPEFTYKGK